MFDTTTVREAVHCIPPGVISSGLPAAREIALSGRDFAPVAWRWLAAALDELDYGVVLLFEGLRVVHLNVAARAELAALHPLQLLAGELRATVARDAAPFHDAIADAAFRGLRRLVTLGRDGERASISVVPLGAGDPAPCAVLVLLGKRSVCESLSTLGFARSHGLTSGETRVLVALCSGVSPAQVAKQFGVALSTVRSQIGSIRAKTGAESIRALIGQVAVLPPVKSVLLTRREVHKGTPPHGADLSVVRR
jgi:DNA-binding CsgD family transcriptional regulator